MRLKRIPQSTSNGQSLTQFALTHLLTCLFRRCKLYCSWLDRKVSKFRTVFEPQTCDPSSLLQSMEVIALEVSSPQGKEEMERVKELIRTCNQSQREATSTSTSLLESVSSFVKEITANVNSSFSLVVSAKDSIPSPKSLIRQVEELRQELIFKNQEMQSDETTIQEMAAIIQQMRYDREEETVSAPSDDCFLFEKLMDDMEQVVKLNHDILDKLSAQSYCKSKNCDVGAESTDLDIVKGYLKKLECNLSNLASSFGDGKSENVRYMDDLKKEMHDLQNKFDSHMQFMVAENEILRKEIRELHNLFDHVYQHQNRCSQMLMIESGGNDYRQENLGSFASMNSMPQDQEKLFSGPCLELHKSFRVKRSHFLELFRVLAQSQGSQSEKLLRENKHLKELLQRSEQEKDQVSKLAHMEKWEREAEYNAAIARLQVTLDEQRQKNKLLDEILVSSAVFDDEDMSMDDSYDQESMSEEEAVMGRVEDSLKQDSPHSSSQLVTDVCSVLNRLNDVLDVSSRDLNKLEENMLTNPAIRSDLNNIFSSLGSVLSGQRSQSSSPHQPCAASCSAHGVADTKGKEEASNRRSSEEIREHEMAQNVEEEMAAFYMKAKRMHQDELKQTASQHEEEEEEGGNECRQGRSMKETEEEIGALTSDFDVDMEMMKARLRSRIFHCRELSEKVQALRC